MTGSSQRVVAATRAQPAPASTSGFQAPAHLYGAARLNGAARPLNGATPRLAGLARTIEAQVIPRLVLARRAAASSPGPARQAWLPSADDVADFARIVRGRDAALAASYVEARRARGVPVESLYLDLLAPAARHLGDLWTADLCPFTEVTLGLCRLQQVLRDLSPAFQDDLDRRLGARRALLVPAPGDQHTFGMFMVAEFFRRAGWEVWNDTLESRADLVRLVRGRWFTVVGFSLSSEVRLEALTGSIRAVRRASRNRAVGVMVGGPIFIEHPELVALVGADATAVDGRQAALQAQNLITLMAGPERAPVE